ncbi:MAG: pyridoxal-5-phosphate-dependent protein subunit beta, partial [Synergistaceae bacterium]|nr:pyridoxal-5-phosphate-dependent protein subunit beta [Synergistaceae bacterium]
MIDLTVNEKQLKNSVEMAKERNILIPTFKQMRDPDKYTPAKMKEKLKTTGLWDVDPANLFRITWKNEPKKSGGLFGEVSTMEFPSEFT